MGKHKSKVNLKYRVEIGPAGYANVLGSVNKGLDVVGWIWWGGAFLHWAAWSRVALPTARSWKDGALKVPSGLKLFLFLSWSPGDAWWKAVVDAQSIPAVAYEAYK